MKENHLKYIQGADYSLDVRSLGSPEKLRVFDINDKALSFESQLSRQCLFYFLLIS